MWGDAPTHIEGNDLLSEEWSAKNFDAELGVHTALRSNVRR
jgi:hypothetical protein